MRPLWILAVMVVLSTPAWAEEKKEKPITYEVKITVTYNAATEHEAAEIARKALVRHGGACKFNVAIKKNGLDISGDLTVTSGTITWLDSDIDPRYYNYYNGTTK